MAAEQIIRRIHQAADEVANARRDQSNKRFRTSSVGLIGGCMTLAGSFFSPKLQTAGFALIGCTSAVNIIFNFVELRDKDCLRQDMLLYRSGTGILDPDMLKSDTSHFIEIGAHFSKLLMMLIRKELVLENVIAPPSLQNLARGVAVASLVIDGIMAYRAKKSDPRRNLEIFDEIANEIATLAGLID